MAVQFDSPVTFGVPGTVTKTAASLGTSSAASAGTAPGFGDALHAVLASVEESAGDANTAVSGMVQGTGDVHDAMIALQRAETTFQLTMQVRNKLVSAYQDIMRMPI